MRKKRETDGVDHKIESVYKVLEEEDIDEGKVIDIKKKVRNMEEKAKRDEKLLRNSKSVSVLNEIAVSDMYLDAVTAKVRLLERI